MAAKVAGMAHEQWTPAWVFVVHGFEYCDHAREDHRDLGLARERFEYSGCDGMCGLGVFEHRRRGLRGSPQRFAKCQHFAFVSVEPVLDFAERVTFECDGLYG